MYGFVLVSSWVTWTRVGRGVPGLMPWPFNVTFFRACAFGVLLVAALLVRECEQRAARAGGPAPAGPGLRAAGALTVAQGVSVIAGAFVTLVGAVGFPVPATLVTLVYGAAPAVLYVAWGTQYMQLQIKDAFACVLVTYIMSAVLNGIIFFMPGSAQPVVVSALLLCGGLLYLVARNSVCRLASGPIGLKTHRPTSGPATSLAVGQKPPLWKFALCLFAYALALSALQLLVLDSQGRPGKS